MKKVTIYQYTGLFEPAEEGGYVVHVPALPECITEGDSLEEAREMAKDAIKGYLESLFKNNEDIPIEPPVMHQEKLSVSVDNAS